jgi:hypothetical protein
MAPEIIARAKDPQTTVAEPRRAIIRWRGPLHHHIDPRDVARAFRIATELPMQKGGFERSFFRLRLRFRRSQHLTAFGSYMATQLKSVIRKSTLDNRLLPYTTFLIPRNGLAS